MERKLRFLEKEIKKDSIPMMETTEPPDAPQPRSRPSSYRAGSVVNPNAFHLDPDPEFWPNLDPDPGLWYQF